MPLDQQKEMENYKITLLRLISNIKPTVTRVLCSTDSGEIITSLFSFPSHLQSSGKPPFTRDPGDSGVNISWADVKCWEAAGNQVGMQSVAPYKQVHSIYQKCI